MNSNVIGPVNIGNDNEFTIVELANLIIQKIDPSLKIVFKKLPMDDPLQRKPVIDIAKKELGWEPKINLNNGLDKTINYFKEVI